MVHVEPAHRVQLHEECLTGAAVHQSGNNNLAEAVDAEKLITITACCCTITSCFCQMPECFGCYSKAVLCCLDEECLACKPSSKDTGCCK